MLDLTQVWAGPVAARILADLGAEVICIEPPTGRGPQVVPASGLAYLGGGRVEPWNMQPVFQKLHRNRSSLCVDLKSAQGRSIFLELVAKSDVVIENFSARAMGRLGLGYEELRAANERIVYVAMPAFGVEGPYRDYVGYGPGVEPMTGLAAVMGYSGSEPRISGIAITDPIAGVAAASAAVTALDARDRTGKGSHVDVSHHEAGVVLLGEYLIEHQQTGREHERLANGHRFVAPHGIFACRGDDDWIAIAARDQGEWAALAAVAACGWAADSRFATPDSRLEHRGPLDEVIGAWTSTQDKFVLARQLMDAGVPAGPVLKVSEYLRDPHLDARGYFAELHHPRTGTQRWDGWPFIFDGTRGYESWAPSPTLGEDNAEILSGLLARDDATIGQLFAARVIADRPPV